jgi:transposase
MEHVAIDLGGRESQVCIRNGAGQILLEERVSTASLRKMLDRPRSRVILETCSEAFGVADLALEFGHDVRVVPASLVRSLGVGARRTKTDRRDAQVLSEVSCRVELPSVHLPSHWSREAKSLCGMRDALVSCRTKVVNSVRGYLRRVLKRMPTGRTAATLPKRVRLRFAELGLPVPPHLERQLKTIEQLNETLKQATADVTAWAAGNPICVRLMTAPGVGAFTALRFVAAIDRVERFPDAHQLEAYLGLTPGEDSSSERKRITSITKAGPAALRWTLVQACWSALRVYPGDPMCAWALQVSRRRGIRVAVVALARKLAGVLYAIWRDGTTYQPRQDQAASAQ